MKKMRYASNRFVFRVTENSEILSEGARRLLQTDQKHTTQMSANKFQNKFPLKKRDNNPKW